VKHEWEDLTQDLTALENQFQEVKQRLQTVIAGELEQEELRARLREISPSMKSEIKQITDRLVEIEVTIETRLFNWGALKEVFWQIVRFTGLGIVIGVMLQRWAGC
jgi:phage shock protein A